MDLLLDGRPVDFALQPGQTLGAAVDQARRLLPDDRMIVAVLVDGTSLLEPQLSEALREPLSSGRRVELESAPRHAVAAEAMRSVAEQLAAVRASIDELASLLTAGRQSQAMGYFAPIIETWRACQVVVRQSGEALGRDLTEHLFEDRPIHGHSDDLAAQLRELRDALESGDVVRLADVMQFEIGPLCERWQRLLDELADSVCPPPASRFTQA